MSKRRKLILMLAALIVLAALIWRLVPRRFDDIMARWDTVLHASGSVVNYDEAFYDALANGEEPDDWWRSFPVSDLGSDCFDAVTSLLGEARVRPDFRNLVPFAQNETTESGYRAAVQLGLFTQNDVAGVNIYDSGLITVAGPGGRGIRTYHLLDKSLAERLAAALEPYCE